MDYANVISANLARELPEINGMNEYAMKLIEGKQASYGPIYSLNSIKPKTLKVYIETHLMTGFIWPTKFSADDLILFDKKFDGDLELCIDYQGPNNLTIKNQYSLPLIGESLDCLGYTKRST